MYEIFENIVNEKGLKVADVVKGTGIRHGVFTDWKMGRYTPKVDKLQIIADFLGVSLDRLMGKEKEPVETDPFLLQIKELTQNASPEKKREILQLASIVLKAQ